jgi:mono/diheme cytochrome c family protein
MEPGSPARGEKVFVEKGCIRCHAVRGKGGHIGPDLGKVELHQAITEIAGRMWNHAPGMWEKMRQMNIPIPRFSDTEISDVMAYLYFLQYYDSSGDAVKGQRIFMEKGCVLCHYAPPGAKPLGPDLTRSHAISSPVELCSAMWNHAPAMEALFHERGLPWPQFADNEVRDLVTYLRSAGKPEETTAHAP